jgi:hypothetical protein
MTRNLEIVRAILKELESQEGMEFVQHFTIENATNEEIVYHLKLMIQKGLIEGEIHGDPRQGWYPLIRGMTWEGHDFLNATKSETVWEKIRAKAAEVGSDLTIEIAKELGKRYLAQQFGIQ